MVGGTSLAPIFKRELANLDKDADSRKSAMKALKSYVKDMDARAIPLFLAQVSETKETGSLSGEYTISLYEVLARVHGPRIVPLIDTIMTTVINTLSASGVSFPLQQACSKVVPAIARYGIEPGTREEEKRRIIHSLCKPLVEALLATQECLSSGAALCLKALVDCDNWRFASDEMVNKVCQNVAVALEEKSTQSNSHMALVMSLSKRNALIVEAYARLLIQSGLRILNSGYQDCGSNSQKRLSAIQMVNFMMKCLDARSIVSTLGLIIEEMEKCQFDQMAYVKGAAFEAMQTAKKIADEGLKFDKSSGSGSVTGSNNLSRKDHRRRGNLSSTPESQTLGSFMDYESMIGSPLSRTPTSRVLEYDCGGSEFDSRSVTRKLWSHENGGVDVSLKDGLFSELARGNSTIKNASSGHARRHSSTENGDHHEGEFSGFLPRTPQNVAARSCTPSPQRSPRSHLNVDNINMFTSPRKLIRSLQDADSESYSRQGRRFRGPCSCQHENSPTSKLSQNEFLGHNNGYASDEKGESYAGGEMYEDVDESVSSTEDAATIDADQVVELVVAEKKTDPESDCFEKGYQNKKSCGWLVAFGVAVFSGLASLVMLFDGYEQGHFLPPT
ncbi:unnamed protein product [Linum tenue]|uniref:TORTIFOLIA1/SINE1-2 N-terminal domain-containing protein n=1 Tax=Linum tenue TaxID=586396 RepID=A0AAV0LH79_9ROSI|nr:unnamed protein product [Linum tenue]